MLRAGGIDATKAALRWEQICEQAEAELCAAEERLYHQCEEVPVIPLELGQFGAPGVVRTPPVLVGDSLAPADLEEKPLAEALRRYGLRADVDAIGYLLELADKKLEVGCLFEHAYAQLELADRLHRQLLGTPCGPALWNQACCLSEAVSMQLARARTSALAGLKGQPVAFPRLQPSRLCARTSAEQRLDTALGLVKRALRAPPSLGPWPPPLEELREADNLDALRRFRGLDTLLMKRGPPERGGRGAKKRRRN